ncbi:MAG: rhodanese-like domain-containing protein [Pseudomonadota bacterium]|nr:rhodanese-like domain-containing protein [Pseudomonadota bacterium]MDP2352622.1 rhodanese-like domain-containing protein [Pseudomonadota bacterium]
MVLNKFILALSITFCLVAAARAEPDLSAPDALAAARAGKLTLIDIRTPAEWRETGVAPGAGRVDFYRGPEVLVPYLLLEVKGDRNAPIGLICRTGNRTTHAQKYLQSIGFTQVYNVKEGMKGSTAGPGWLKRGLPVEPCTTC